MTEVTIIITVEKWQVKPEPKWIYLKTHEVKGTITPKRIKAYGRTFDRATGRDIGRCDPLSFYKFSAQVKP